MRNKPLLAVACVAAAAVLVLVVLQLGGDAPLPGDGSAAAGSPAAPPDAVSTGERGADAPAPDPTRSEVQAAASAAASNAPSGPRPTELWGRVVDASTRAAVAGANVELQHRDADEFWNLDLKYGERVATLARTKSDTDGRFRFDVERARQHRVHAAAAGYAAATVLHRTGGEEVLIELSRGAAIDGVVRCEGSGLPDLDVRIAVRGESVELARGRTDGGGAFRFTGLPAAPVFVQVSSSQFEEEWKQLDLEVGKQHRIEIELQRGKTLRGRVVEATTGAPVVDAEVSDSWVFRRVVRTDADGRFAIAGLKDETYVMCHVRAPGYATAGRNVGGHLAEEAEFRLVRGGEVVGRIVDGAGAPVPAYVAVCASYMEAAGMGGSDWVPAAIGSDGRFQVLGLRPDQHYWLFARAAGFGSRVYALARRLVSGERLDVGDVVLRAAGGIEGRVADDAGAALPGLEVDIRGTNGDNRAWLTDGASPPEVSQFESRSAHTDGNGVFRFTGVAAGSYQVSVRPPGGGQDVATTVAVQDGAVHEGVELVVVRGLVITGAFAYTNGQAPGDELTEAYLQATPAKGGESYTGRVGAHGTFRFEGVRDGEYTITVFHPPKGWTLAPVLGVRAGSNDVKLLLEPPAFLTGRVVDGDGKGVRAQMWVHSEGVTSGASIQSADDDGRFRLEVPPSFRGTVGAALPNDWSRQTQLAGIVAGQSDIVITLKSR